MSRLWKVLQIGLLYLIILSSFLLTSYYAILIVGGAASLVLDYGQNVPRTEIDLLFRNNVPHFLIALLIVGASLSRLQKRK